MIAAGDVIGDFEARKNIVERVALNGSAVLHKIADDQQESCPLNLV